MITDLNELASALYHFDYYYEYSDDHSVYTRGRERKEYLQRSVKALQLNDSDITLVKNLITKISQERNVKISEDQEKQLDRILKYP